MKKVFLFLFLSVFSLSNEKSLTFKSNLNLKTDIIKFEKTHYNLSEIKNDNEINLELNNQINDFSFKILQNNKIDTSKSVLNTNFYSLNITNNLKSPKILNTSIGFENDLFISDNKRFNRENLNLISSIYLKNENPYFDFKAGLMLNKTVNKPLYEYSVFSNVSSKYIDLNIKYLSILNQRQHQINMYNTTKKLILDDGHNHNENKLNVFSEIPYNLDDISKYHNNEKYIFSNKSINTEIIVKPIENIYISSDFKYGFIDHNLGNYLKQSIREYDFNLDFLYKYNYKNINVDINPKYSLNILNADYQINDIFNLNSRYKVENILNHSSIINLTDNSVSLNTDLNYTLPVTNKFSMDFGLNQELTFSIKRFKVKEDIFNNRKKAYLAELENVKKFEENLTDEKIKERKELEKDFLNKIDNIDEKLSYLNNLKIDTLIDEYDKNYSDENSKLDNNLKNQFITLFKDFTSEDLKNHYSSKVKEYINFTKENNIKNDRNLYQAILKNDKEKANSIFKEMVKENYSNELFEKYYFYQTTYISNNGLKSIKTKLDNIFFSLERERNKIKRDMKNELSVVVDENIKKNFEMLNELQNNIYIIDYEINPYINLVYNVNENILFNINSGMNFEYNKILNNLILYKNKKKISYPINYYINLEVKFNF